MCKNIKWKPHFVRKWFCFHDWRWRASGEILLGFVWHSISPVLGFTLQCHYKNHCCTTLWNLPAFVRFLRKNLLVVYPMLLMLGLPETCIFRGYHTWCAEGSGPLPHLQIRGWWIESDYRNSCWIRRSESDHRNDMCVPPFLVSAEYIVCSPYLERRSR